VFGSLATVAWLCVLILNLHLHTVWNTQVLRYHYFWLHLFCWGVPFLLTFLTVSKKAIRYEFGELCTVDHEYANVLFFYPIFVLVVPAFVVHIGTFFYIGKISMRARMVPTSLGNLITAFRIQWRAFALAVSLTISVLLFSFFYFDVVALLNEVLMDPTKLSDWSTCLLEGGNQNSCASQNTHILPAPSRMFIAESVVSAMGIVFFLIFAVQQQFIKDWRLFIVQRWRKKRFSLARQQQQQQTQAAKDCKKYTLPLYDECGGFNAADEDVALYGSHGMVDFTPDHIEAMCMPRAPQRATVRPPRNSTSKWSL